MRILASTPVLVLWWAALILTVAVIVPVAVYLLHRTWKAARSIRRYTEEAAEAGGGVAEHAGAVRNLDATVRTAVPLVEKVRVLEEATGRMTGILRRRVSG